MNEIEKVFDKYNLTGSKRKCFIKDIKKVISNILKSLQYDTYNCKFNKLRFKVYEIEKKALSHLR